MPVLVSAEEARRSRRQSRSGAGTASTFLLCTFWLVQALAQRGDYEEATSLFKRAVSLRNDVGLLGEEYDVEHRRMLGNFPQAFSHIGLLTAARSLSVGRAV